MPRYRIIPRLDIKNGFLVKGVKLEGLRTLGRANLFAQYYAELGVDELLLTDAVASLYGRNSLHDLVREITQSLFIPVTVGGGIRSVYDAAKLLENGADKVCVNTAALDNVDLLSELVNVFGSSTIMLSIQIKKMIKGDYALFSSSGRNKSKRDIFQWIKEAEERGVGEILVTSIDRDGTGDGFDIDITRKIKNSVGIPVIASGGAGSQNDLLSAYSASDALAIASLFHYEALEKVRNISTEIDQNPDFKIIEKIKNNKFDKIIDLEMVRNAFLEMNRQNDK